MKRRIAKEQKLADNAYLLRAWHKWHHDELAKALIGLHRDVMGRLMAELRSCAQRASSSSRSKTRHED